MRRTTIVLFVIMVGLGAVALWKHYFWQGKQQALVCPLESPVRLPPCYRQPKEPALTPQEAQAIRAQLASEVNALSNELTLHLTNGRKLEGVRLAEDETHIKVKQIFGRSGSMITKIAKKDIAKIEVNPSQDLDFSEQEIRSKKRFPDFHFIRKGDYSFFTDESYLRITDTLSLLKQLRSAFIASFEPLLAIKPNRRICVIIFGDHLEFEAYRAEVAPHLAGAVGFYNVSDSRLVVYNFFRGDKYQGVKDYVEEEQAKIDEIKKQELCHRSRQKIGSYERSLHSYLKRTALQIKSQNVETIRHEGAHQLSYDLGLIDSVNFDTWLIEGLAEYCATPYIGQIRKRHLKLFKGAVEAGNYIRLKALFDYTAGGKFYRLKQDEASLIYASSWLLFYHLMQPSYRDNFFNYIQSLKGGPPRELAARIELLEEKLGVSLEELEAELIAWVTAE